MSKILNRLTDEHKQIIIDNHNKLTLSQMMALIKDNPFTYNQFRHEVHKLGLFRDKTIRIPTKNRHDTEVWKTPNLTNCYYAGAVAADGCIGINQYNTYTFSYSVSVKDEFFIDQWIDFLSFTGQKTYVKHKSLHGGKTCKMVSIRMTGFQNNAKYLKEHFNLTPNKTTRLGPTNLSNPMFNLAYIIGAIDGDGTVCFLNDKTTGKRLKVGLVSCSKPIIDWVKTIIDEKFPSFKRAANVGYHKKLHYYSFFVTGTRAAVIVDYLKDFPVPKYKRKWHDLEVLDYINKQKEKYPQYFLNPPIFENNLTAAD